MKKQIQVYTIVTSKDHKYSKQHKHVCVCIYMKHIQVYTIVTSKAHKYNKQHKHVCMYIYMK